MSGWKHAPSHVRAALDHLRTKFTTPPEGTVDLEWARRIVARKNAGETVSQAALDMAREALTKNGVKP